MPLTLGEKPCPRGLDADCSCIDTVASDDGSTFCCAGLLRKPETDDRMRHCFRSIDTDTMHDYDNCDLADSIAVLGKALCVALRLD